MRAYGHDWIVKMAEDEFGDNTAEETDKEDKPADDEW